MASFFPQVPPMPDAGMGTSFAAFLSMPTANVGFGETANDEGLVGEMPATDNAGPPPRPGENSRIRDEEHALAVWQRIQGVGNEFVGLSLRTDLAKNEIKTVDQVKKIYYDQLKELMHMYDLPALRLPDGSVVQKEKSVSKKTPKMEDLVKTLCRMAREGKITFNVPVSSDALQIYMEKEVAVDKGRPEVTVEYKHKQKPKPELMSLALLDLEDGAGEGGPN